jgi:peptide/nickel transport system substrate-binding protein
MKQAARKMTWLWMVLALVWGAVGFAQKVGGEVVVAISSEPDSLDPQKSATAVVNQIMRYIGDTLVNKDLNGRYTPGLATQWTPSRDRLSWTFTLRKGVKFHDGSELDAEAVRASFMRAKDPKTQSAVAAGLLGPVKEVQVKDEYTVVFQLVEPYALLIENLTQQALAVVNARAADKAGAGFGRQPVLTGAWKVGPWASGSQIVLERNPDYNWGPAYAHKGPAYINKLIFRVIPDQATATAAFLAGNVDVLTVAPSDIERIKDAKKYTVLSFMRKGLGLFMAFNVNKPPFTDQRVRQAMAYLINKDPLVALSLRGFGDIACGPLPPSIVGYWDGICDYAPKFNVEKGLALLEQAGYRKVGNNLVKDGQPLKFSLMLAPNYGYVQSAQIVQAQLRNLGIQVDINQMEQSTVLAKGRDGDHEAIFMGYTYTSADIMNSYLNSRNIRVGYNWSHYKDQKIDDWLADSRSTSDDDERMEIYKSLQKYVIDKALWLPLWINDNYFAIQPFIKGAKLSKEGFLSFLDAYTEE